MELLLATPGGENSETVNVHVSEKTFGRDFNESLVHQVITAYLSGGRAGTKAQITRNEGRGGGAKPWRQKGTGRARAGSIRSIIWRGGDTAFPAKPQDHTQKVNRKMYRGAMRAILSELVRQKRLILIKDIALTQPKTRELLAKLAQYDIKEALIVIQDWNLNLHLAARNVPKVDVREASKLDPVSLVKYEKVLITENAIRKIEEVFG